MRRPALLAVPLAALAACTTVQVTPAGNRVVLVTAAEPYCAVVGPVIGGAGGSPYSADVVEEATRDVRNAAAEQGADTLVLSPPQVLEGGVAVAAVGYRCGPEAVDGWIPASVPFGSKILRAPDRKAAVVRTLPPRSAVQVTERVVNGYRRVKLDVGPTGFVEDGLVELVR